MSAEMAAERASNVVIICNYIPEPRTQTAWTLESLKPNPKTQHCKRYTVNPVNPAGPKPTPTLDSIISTMKPKALATPKPFTIFRAYNPTP